MRISDWSSDVCSSDLFRENGAAGLLAFAHDWEYTNGRSQRQVVIFSHSRKCDRAHRAETAGKAPGPAYIRYRICEGRFVRHAHPSRPAAPGSHAVHPVGPEIGRAHV